MIGFWCLVFVATIIWMSKLPNINGYHVLVSAFLGMGLARMMIAMWIKPVRDALGIKSELYMTKRELELKNIEINSYKIAEELRAEREKELQRESAKAQGGTEL